jgi:GH15 family glucan-1,4-alpha-glucosidase
MAAPELDPTAVPQAGSERSDGYVELQSYAPIGDTRTVALVARDGGVDWWPIPHLDATAPFARILDAANGGRLELTPTEDAETTRRYLPETAVLETTHTTASGVVRVTDSLNTGIAGPLPWTELARRVDGVRGHVPMRWTVAPGTCFNTAAPWTRETTHGPVLRVNGITMSVLLDGASCDELTDQAMSGTLTTAPGSRHLVGVSATAGQPLHVPTAREVDDGVDRTIANWERWSGQFECTGPWDAAVRRSAIILKLLIHGPSGAVTAAATTSLPESRAGGKNWDYRFAWIRDTAYTLKALFRFGLREETQSAVSWLLDTIERHGPRMHVFYNLDGSLPATEPEQPEVPGWRGIGPVVLGNAAASQVQLSVYGDLFDTIQLYVDNGHVLNSAIGRQLAAIADMACDAWRSRDAGMWELERQEHYTSSKLSCWQALRAAVHLAEMDEIPGDSARWASEAEHISEWVHKNCWSEERQSYVWYPGTTDLDASILLHAGSGFDTGPRMSATIDALRAELGSGPLLYRYTGADKEEGAFVACAFWMVSALHVAGRTSEARTLMDELVPLTNDAGVLAEMIDPTDGSFLGNLPQGLSHLALIGAALDLTTD